jgi:LPXTG-site transpeptidase (sortase) family protein
MKGGAVRMKIRSYVTAFALAALLAGCSQAPSMEKNDAGKQETSSGEVASEQAATLLSPPSSEGLTLQDDNEGIQPIKIEIPKLNVSTAIEEVGRLENGQMGVPQDTDQVGWFAPGIKPGSPGNAVMAGHVDSLTGPSVFYELDKLKKGDEILVYGSQDEVLTFTVVKTEVYPREDAPVDSIFGFTYGSGLNLITCTGEYNRSVNTHEERLVVYTELSAR